MQFFFLLLFNIFMGAVMYLIISLKLERSATEFRERKLRKEMENVIHEFNAAAERNISILENKIKILRRLLEKSGDMKLFDVTIDEQGRNLEGAASAAKGTPRPEREYEKGSEAGVVRSADFSLRGEAAGLTIKKGLLLFFEKIMDITPFKRTKDTADYSSGGYVRAGTQADERTSGAGEEEGRVLLVARGLNPSLPEAP